jgi:hypothetical protein
MAEAGMEMPKIGIKQRVVEAFTPRGAKEKWYRDHAETIKKYADVHNGLTDEQRQQKMADIEEQATKSANVNVLKNVGATAVVTAVLATTGALIKNPDLAKRFADWSAGKKFGVGKVGELVHKGAQGSHDFLVKVWTKAGELKQRALDRGKALFTKAPVVEVVPPPPAEPPKV